MDGYVITATADEALAAWGRPGVRHVAELDTGEGFVAFDGPIPAAGLVMEAGDDDGWWFRVRRVAPSSDHEPETFGLYGADAFRALPPFVVRQASMVGAGMVLALTLGKQTTATWQADATRYLDVRVPLPVSA